jgi:hypothetical protein
VSANQILRVKAPGGASTVKVLPHFSSLLPGAVGADEADPRFDDEQRRPPAGVRTGGSTRMTNVGRCSAA